MFIWLNNHKETTEYHYPGHNYTGPGTNVVRRIFRGDMPVNYQDAVTLLHDVDYMSHMSPDVADDKAISLSDYSLSGIVTKMGLTIRKALGLRFNAPSYIGKVLKMYLRIDPKYKQMLTEYGLYRKI